MDDYSRFTWLYTLQNKSDLYDILLQFLLFVKSQFSRNHKIFHSDGCTEFTNNKVQILFQDKGIRHTFSCHTHHLKMVEQNRSTDTLLNRSYLLFHFHSPMKFWVDAFSSVVYVINRLPTRVLDGKSPFKVLFSVAHNYENFHPFGCRVYPCLRDYIANKFQPHSAPCIFLGYSSSHKEFRCFDPKTFPILHLLSCQV